MIPHKFRAKALVNNKYTLTNKGDWVHGSYIESGCDAPCIVYGDGEQVEVDKSTLGCLLGFDNDNTPIHTGDIVKFLELEVQSKESNGMYFEEITNRGVVFWNDVDYCFDITNRNCDKEDAFSGAYVIGNKYDNKELLEGY